MDPELREMPAQRVVAMSHSGPYPTIGTTFHKFGGWVKENGIKIGPFFGIYYDNPQSTPPEQLRSDAGAVVDLAFTTDDPSVHVVDVPAATYAVYTHVGSYETIGDSWQRFMGWFFSNGHQFGEFPAFEVYVDDIDDTPVERLRTELCMSVK